MTIISFKRNYCHIFLMLSPMSYFPCLNKFVIYQDIVGYVNLNIFKFPPPLHKIWQEEGQTKSPCHDQLWISRPASKCRLTQSTSNIKYIHPISNTFIQYQTHSSNIKYIDPTSNTFKRFKRK